MTSSRDRGSSPRLARRLSPTLPEISPAWATTPSSEPCSASHFAAVFGPTLGTPGTLSTGSPTRVRKSTIRAGGTPNFAATPAGSSRVLSMVLTRETRSLTSWARSLSPVEITTR